MNLVCLICLNPISITWMCKNPLATWEVLDCSSFMCFVHPLGFTSQNIAACREDVQVGHHNIPIAAGDVNTVVKKESVIHRNVLLPFFFDGINLQSVHIGVHFQCL